MSEQDIPRSAPASEPESASVLPEKVPARAGTPGSLTLVLMSLGVLSLGALALAWQGHSRVRQLEQELVRRQDQSQTQATDARVMATRAQDVAQETAAKLTLLDARLAEVALQRGQLEELIQSMSRSRDENVLGDIEASLRVALQQTSITGSAEPLVSALKQADERLQRYKQPRLEGVRRAVIRDLDRVKAVSVVDVASLGIKLDEVARLADELPLLSVPERAAMAEGEPRPEMRPDMRPDARLDAKARKTSPAPAKPASAAEGWDAWWGLAQDRWKDFSTQVWQETKSLVRVTRISHPEAALITPEQGYFLRENLKLRLLNARLALLSRQYDTAQADLREVLALLDRYFDMRSRKAQSAAELLRQVQGQARQVAVPRPDDSLAALAAAGR
ncbi:uroporphyrinogen-III C-methyltransferase [Pelomonas sp. APW6]|uniref:Uroporphyrinogen-III C-methyltransferase n=1 Tax=Roseateles subflavus TaxID=3053353 RepID=A0ABT7LHK5_9BURK|nr:uroporphyrinogen-III C-methyltransferase [Pelomonas sp. APW6]MDL5032324.1 uroporphyrinogen-III C-methyltransferase [Pelomonas sp. APW6]